MSDQRWLNAEATARYISVRVDALPRLVKQGRIPAPAHTLGPRRARWDRLALDATFEGGSVSTNVGDMVRAGVEKILASRPFRARRRSAR